MPALSIRLFGQFSICCGDEALENLVPGKAKELFCYLLTHRQRPIARESLASILWDDCTTEHSRQYLRKALWQLQSALCHHVASASSILQVDSQWVSVRPSADIWVDVTEFERACPVNQNSRWFTDGSFRPVLAAAVDLYRGDLLEGWYQDWCLCDRERLQNTYLVMLDRLVNFSQMHHECDKGIAYATRILQCDRAHEIAHQHLMRLRYLSGDRAGALRQFQNCAAALKEELEVQPSKSTRELYRQIREDCVSAIEPVAESGAREVEDDPSLLHTALNRLEEARSALTVLQNAVDESLLRVGAALRSSSSNPASASKNRSK